MLTTDNKFSKMGLLLLRTFFFLGFRRFSRWEMYSPRPSSIRRASISFTEMPSFSAATAGDTGALEAKVAADPKDYQSRIDLAKALAAHGKKDEALTHLLDAIRRDRADIQPPRG